MAGLAGIGTLLSGVGSLVGAASPWLSKGSHRSRVQKEFPVQALVNDARNMGIHPLAAMGISSSYQPAGGIGKVGEAGKALKETGDALGKFSKTKLAARAVEGEIAVNESQARLMEAQRLSVLNGVANTRRGGTAPVGPMPNPKSLLVPVTHGGKTSYQANPELGMDISEAFTVFASRLLSQMYEATDAGKGWFPKIEYSSKPPSKRTRKYGNTNVGGPQP